MWRAPEGPEGTGGLRDRPLRAVRLACGDLAGGRARRRPEHQQSHKQQAQSQITAAPPVRRAPEGPEGTRGPGCGARGRRRGLAELRANAPSHTLATRRRRCGGRRRDLLRCRWAAAGTGRASSQRADHTSATRRRRCGGRRRDLLRCRWAAAGPGRASRRRAERSSRRGRLAGGPPPTGTHSGRARRRPEHQRRHKHHHQHHRTEKPQNSS